MNTLRLRNLTRQRVSEDGIELEKENIDVYEETSCSAKKMAPNDITSSYADVLNGTDTRLKGSKVRKTDDRLFGRWNWYANAIECSRGCKILIGWDTYKPWVIMGDLNVSLNIEDHSEGISHMTHDMEEFKDCINDIKMDDICSTGLHYTWIKSLLNPNASILKKIDRVMGNEEFLEDYQRVHVVFLPCGISDHSPAVLKCPQTIKAKRFYMYKLVQKLKAIKPVMKNFNWKNGNLFDNVKKLKKELDEVQTKIDADPTNSHIRKKGVSLFKEYNLALEDEEKLLLQKTKVDWLKEGDRNSAYFHKVLKIRSNKSRVEEICDENRNNKECLDLDENMFSKNINEQEAYNMINIVTNKEIKEAMSDIDDNKAPSPDGFTAKFFKKAWNVNGDDICKAATEFFLKGFLGIAKLAKVGEVVISQGSVILWCILVAGCGDGVLQVWREKLRKGMYSTLYRTLITKGQELKSSQRCRGFMEDYNEHQVTPEEFLLGVTVLMNASFLVQFGLGRKLASNVWYYERFNSGGCTIRLNELGLDWEWKRSQEYMVFGAQKVKWKAYAAVWH
nr:hypothetical protein [Tanacetum cinerariifolium]